MKTISAERIAQIEARRDELQAMMATGDLPSDRFVAVSKEYAELEPVANAAAEVRRLRQEADSLAFMTQDGDDELRELAAEELHANRNALAAADRHLALALLPRDAADERAAMLEIRREPAATRRRCSRATCSACTSVMPSGRAGGSR